MMENSGYTSVTINDEDINLRFGIPAVRMFLQKIASDVVLISGDTINEIGIANLLYCGYVNNCMVNDEVPTKTLGFFLTYVEEAWIDDNIKKQIEHVSAVYAASRYTQKLTKTVSDNLEGVKKKMTKKK